MFLLQIKQGKYYINNKNINHNQQKMGNLKKNSMPRNMEIRLCDN
jgi:hypothetical protein